MQGKKRSGPVVVTESAAQAALRWGSLAELASEEEKVMRMRLGAGVPLSARLARIATATDAEIEVLAYEIEAFLRMKERSSRANGVVHSPPATTSRVKEKIVRALRKKM
jgi:hypothetical protein